LHGRADSNYVLIDCKTQLIITKRLIYYKPVKVVQILKDFVTQTLPGLWIHQVCKIILSNL